MLTEDELVAKLREVTSGNRLREWARLHEVSPAYVSRVIRGEVRPGEKIATALGFERVIGYRRLRS